MKRKKKTTLIHSSIERKYSHRRYDPSANPTPYQANPWLYTHRRRQRSGNQPNNNLAAAFTALEAAETGATTREKRTIS